MFKHNEARGLEAAMLMEILKKLQDGGKVGVDIKFKTIADAIDDGLSEGVEPDYRKLAKAQKSGNDGVGLVCKINGTPQELAVLFRQVFESNPDFYIVLKTVMQAYEYAYENKKPKSSNDELDSLTEMVNETIELYAHDDDMVASLKTFLHHATEKSKYASMNEYLDTLDISEKMAFLSSMQIIHRLIKQ